MKTITFYSYKGGVGRTLALANFAQYLAKAGRSVFVMDLDLEAPGLHYKLRPQQGKLNGDLGFISYFNVWHHIGKISENIEKFIYEYKTHLPSKGKIYVMPAGNPQEDSYWHELRNLDWRTIFREEEGFEVLLNLKYQIRNYSAQPDYLLIDARTGIGEVGGFVATLLSDSVVLLFNNNNENLDGIMQMARKLSQVPLLDRQEPINIFPVVVRLPAIDPEYDDIINTEINKFFKYSLQNSIKKIKLFDSQILHTDREIEVAESLLIGDYQANESSVLYRDYLIFFNRLLGMQTFPKDALLDATEVSYGERMNRVISILELLKTETNFLIPKNLLKKIQIGAVISKPESYYSDKPRCVWSLEKVKEWEFSLPDKLKSFDEFKELWVLLPHFLPYSDPDFREITGNNLMAGARYIYFLPDSNDVTRLKTVAVEIVNHLIEERKETKEEIKAKVAENLRYVFVTKFVTNELFRAFLRHLNYWIANPGSNIPDNDSCPQGFEVVTERGKPRGAVPLKAIECQEIFNLVKYSLGDGTALEGFSAID